MRIARRRARGPLLALGLCGLFTPGRATAQAAPVRVVVEPPTPALEAAWRARVQALLAEEGVALAAPAPPARPAGVTPARLAALDAVAQRLEAGRRALAGGAPDTALRALLSAEAALTDALSVPGVARYWAELQLQLGVVAAERGDERQARQAFGRAAGVDPSRRLQAGEAPDPVVSLAWEAARAVHAAPPSRFVVRSKPPGEVFLDDRPLGPSPARVGVSPGRHLLRVEAPGWLPYAAWIDAFSGDRSELTVHLAPREPAPPAPPSPGAGQSPVRFAARVLAFSRAYPEVILYWLRPAPGSREGALFACQAGTCVYRRGL